MLSPSQHPTQHTRRSSRLCVTPLHSSNKRSSKEHKYRSMIRVLSSRVLTGVWLMTAQITSACVSAEWLTLGGKIYGAIYWPFSSSFPSCFFAEPLTIACLSVYVLLGYPTKMHTGQGRARLPYPLEYPQCQSQMPAASRGEWLKVRPKGHEVTTKHGGTTEVLAGP